MTKKLWSLLGCLICSIVVAYMYVGNEFFQQLNAQSAPTFNLPKGAKVVLGKYNNKEVVWDIGNNNNNGNYVLMSSKPIVNSIAKYDPSIGCIPVYPNDGHVIACLKCPNTKLDNEVGKIVKNDVESKLLVKDFFIPNYQEIKTGGSLGLSISDRAYLSTSGIAHYWLNDRGLSLGWGDPGTVWDGDLQTLLQGMRDSYGSVYGLPESDVIWAEADYQFNKNTGAVTTIRESALRPFGILDKIKVNFAANIAYTDGNWHQYKIDTNNLSENNELNPNKLRVQSSLTVSLQDIKRNDHSTNKIMKNGSVDLSINANIGTSTRISVILYNETGTDIKYYKMLEVTKNGTNEYVLDLTGVATGKYQLAVINEEYDASSNLPVESSPISDLLPLEIVEPLSNLSFTSKTDLKFNQNVNVGNTIGTISSQNGAGTPVYTIIPDPAYPNEYTNVSLASDGKTVVVNGAPLHAGTYHFKIQAQDQNDDPDPALEISASFTVNKTNLSVAFDDPNQTKKSIAQATTGWSETASVTPSISAKVTYSKSGGSVGIINLDPDTGAITYTGGTAYGKITIKAIADDDPNNGYDDYQASEVTKEIVIYREVDGNVTPDSASSDSGIPTFKTSDANIKPNGIIGTIHGTMGTPDNITSGSTTYTYGLKNVDDHSYFSVDKSTGIIKTTADLSATTGTYQIIVTVSDKWSTKEIS
ncbi:MAG: cadherin repeat domain-containing protein, partial [Erysipelotrichaceae bacterium]|nr:cadherin repeat domain-containing protein [Erysipelotrichaceae bacterium]